MDVTIPKITPAAAQKYADTLSKFTGLPVDVVSSGTEFSFSGAVEKGQKVLESASITSPKLAITLGNLSQPERLQQSLEQLALPARSSFSTAEKGQLLLDASDIATYEGKQGAGSFATFMQQIKSQVTDAIQQAQQAQGPIDERFLKQLTGALPSGKVPVPPMPEPPIKLKIPDSTPKLPDYLPKPQIPDMPDLSPPSSGIPEPHLPQGLSRASDEGKIASMFLAGMVRDLPEGSDLKRAYQQHAPQPPAFEGDMGLPGHLAILTPKLAPQIALREQAILQSTEAAMSQPSTKKMILDSYEEARRNLLIKQQCQAIAGNMNNLVTSCSSDTLTAPAAASTQRQR